MPRGVTSPVGTETTNANGYIQVKTEDRGWVGKHTLILEASIGRQLLPGERAIFKDNNRQNLDAENIELSVTKGSINAKIARLQAEVDDRIALINDLKAKLARENFDEE